MRCPTCLKVQQRLKKNVEQVQQTLCNKNQVKSFSLSVTFHPTSSISLSYKCTDSPSVISKPTSVTSVPWQISLWRLQNLTTWSVSTVRWSSLHWSWTLCSHLGDRKWRTPHTPSTPGPGWYCWTPLWPDTFHGSHVWECSSWNGDFQFVPTLEFRDTIYPYRTHHHYKHT